MIWWLKTQYKYQKNSMIYWTKIKGIGVFILLRIRSIKVKILMCCAFLIMIYSDEEELYDDMNMIKEYNNISSEDENNDSCED